MCLVCHPQTEPLQQHTSNNSGGACLSCLAHGPCNGFSAGSKARHLKPAHRAVPEQRLAAHHSCAEKRRRLGPNVQSKATCSNTSLQKASESHCTEPAHHGTLAWFVDNGGPFIMCLVGLVGRTPGCVISTVEWILYCRLLQQVAVGHPLYVTQLHTIKELGVSGGCVASTVHRSPQVISNRHTVNAGPDQMMSTTAYMHKPNIVQRSAALLVACQQKCCTAQCTPGNNAPQETPLLGCVSCQATGKTHAGCTQLMQAHTTQHPASCLPSGTHGHSLLQQPSVTGTVQQPTPSSRLRATTTSTGRTSCTPRS